MSTSRILSPLDRLLDSAQNALSTVAGSPRAERANPGDSTPDVVLDDAERRHAAGLMRINHVGEVCAQALYIGQAAVARDPATRAHLLEAAQEETDHLAWCADRLRGKHKPVFTPHVDTGDYLVVINAEKIAVTGKKLQDKMYHRFTGYVGNLKTESLAQALERHPERVIEIAVKGMLPKNTLGRAMYRKLKVYKGSEHPHAAQQPQTLDI